MTKSLLAALALLSLLAAAVPAATAHGAAPPMDYVTRILSDYSDDWLSFSSNGQAVAPKDGHNLIALDAYPQWNASLGGDVVVFRLVMDGGWMTGSSKPELAEHITFKANGKDQELAIHTEDNAAFTSELGFKAVRGPFVQTTADRSTADGSRFYVEGLMPFSELGIKAGDSLSGFFVQGEAGDGEGDAMPQDDLAVAGTPDATGDSVHFDIGSWVVPAPSRYVTASAAAPKGPVPAAGDLAVDVTVGNAFNESQSVMAMAYGDSVWTSFQGAPAGNTSMAMLDLAGLKSGTLTLHLARATGPGAAAMPGMAMADTGAPAPQHGGVSLVLTSNLGGRTVLPLDLQVAQPTPAANATMTHDHDHAPAKKSPAPGVAVLPALALAAVLLRRRRA